MKIRQLVIIICFLIVILFPYGAKIIGSENNLKGSEETVEFNIDDLDPYILQNFPGRWYIVKTKNEMLYKLFDITTNENVTKIGDTLFSTETLDYWLYNHHFVDDNYIEDLSNKFKIFKDYCDINNKKMLIVLTPTKPRYYKGKYSKVDEIIKKNSKNNNEIFTRPYDKLKREMEKMQIECFDCIEYIDNNKEIIEGEIPLFYKNGHHWSNYKGNLVGLGLQDYVRNKFSVKIPKLKITATPSDVSMHPDSDLYDILNLYEKPNEKYYEPILSFENYETDNKKYIVQGGSFLGQLLIPQMIYSIDGSSVEIVNKEMFLDNFSKTVTFDSWEEANEKYNLLDRCKNADIFIFEINEINVYNATFGFLDFLIKNII